MQVGKQIQHYRKKKNLSQDDLAEIIFVSRQSISNWERGATYPDIQNLLLLSKVFEVSFLSSALPSFFIWMDTASLLVA